MHVSNSHLQLWWKEKTFINYHIWETFKYETNQEKPHNSLGRTSWQDRSLLELQIGAARCIDRTKIMGSQPEVKYKSDL